MANKARIVYVDDRPDDVVAMRPKHTIAAERKYGAKAQTDNAVEASLYMAWYALGMPGGSDGFVAWLDNVDEMAAYEEPAGADASDPLEPASSDTSPI